MVHNHQVPIARTILTEDEIGSVLEPLRSGWLVQGPRVRAFEEAWSSFTGAGFSVAVTSGTSALHLALAAQGFGPGDEAIVPAFTWVSTANVVEHLGGTVRFCDIDPVTFNIDMDQAAALVGPMTRAILPVHLFGLPANMAAVRALAEKHDLLVVEDAACGFGSRIGTQHVGTADYPGCFSFHPRKAITTGEGGMVTTNDEALANGIRRLRDHGATMSDLQRHLGARPYLLADHTDAGYNQRMTDIQAALGVAQMNRATEILVERKRLAAIYDAAFSDLGWLRTPAQSEGTEHSYQSYACMLKPDELTTSSIPGINAQRNEWMDDLLKQGISTRPATHAVHMLTYYREKYDLRAGDMPGAWAANDCSISLPLFTGMTSAEQERVIEAVRAAPF